MRGNDKEELKTLIEKKKKKKKVNSALRDVRTDFRSMMGEERLNSFMADVLIIKKPVH